MKISIVYKDAKRAERFLREHLWDGGTTFYICRGRSCLPPVNELPVLLNCQ